MRMTLSHSSRVGPTRLTIRAAQAFALFGALILIGPLASNASAQRGGMGGGMGRGGGGGRGGMGGGRGGGMRGGSETPEKRLKDEFKKSDPVVFLLDRKKPLKLTGIQKDSLKTLHKELDHSQDLLFKDIEKLFAEMPRGGGGGGGRAGGGAGGGGDRGGRAELQEELRPLIAKLTDTQSAFGDRARAQLDGGQRHMADSLKTVYLAEQRDREVKDARGGGRNRGRR